MLIPDRRGGKSVLGNVARRVVFMSVATLLLGAAPPFRGPVTDTEPLTPIIPKDLPVRDGPRLTLVNSYDAKENLLGFQFLDKGRILISGMWDPPVIFWDTRTGKVKGKLDVEICWGVACSPDGKILATGSGDGSVIQLTDASSLKPIATLEGHKRALIDLVFLPDNRRLLSFARDGTARMWDTKTRKQIYSIVRSEDWILFPNYALSPDSSLLVTGDGTELTVWDVRTGKKLREASVYANWGVKEIRFSPDGKHLGCHNNVGCAGCVLRAKDLQKVGDAPEGKVYGASIGAMLTGDRMVVRNGEGMQVWNYKTKRIEARLQVHRELLEDVLLSADGKRMVSVDQGGVGYVWDVKTWRPILKLTGMGGKPRVLELSPDGLSLAYRADREGVVYLHDLTVPAKKPVVRPK